MFQSLLNFSECHSSDLQLTIMSTSYDPYVIIIARDFLPTRKCPIAYYKQRVIIESSRVTAFYKQQQLPQIMLPKGFSLILLFLLASRFQYSVSQEYTMHVNSEKVKTSSLTRDMEVPYRNQLSTAESLVSNTTKLFQKTYPVTRECPTWMYLSNQTNECVCGVSHHDMVKCNATLNETYILDCHQMTFDKKLQKVIAGLTFYGCVNQANPYVIYHRVPANRSQINEVMCSPFRRGGRLCGACRDGYSPLVYSYQLNCKQCSNTESKYNWAIFIAIAFIPLTIFYMFVVLFKFNANSPHLHGFVFFAQIIGAPANIRALTQGWKFGTIVTFVSKLLATLYGVWNLDYFRVVYPDICLRLTTLQVLSLDYAIAFYPLLLILASYMAITLNSRIQLSPWKPVKRCFLKFRKESSTKLSMIDVFATFLLLAYSKILYINFDLLTPTVPVDPSGNSVGTFLYLDASYEYFGPDHLPYGVLALILLTIFNIIPFLLLLFYPMKCFQTCLNRFKLSHLALHTFVDSFAGCYKDGTEPGTRDCRYFAAMFLFLRITISIIFQATRTAIAYGWTGMILTAFTVLLVIAQPYRSKYTTYNTVTTTMFGIMILIMIGVMNINTALAKVHQSVMLSIIITAILIAVPQLYATGMAVKWIYMYKRKNFKRFLVRSQILGRSPSESPLLETTENEPKTLAYGIL